MDVRKTVLVGHSAEQMFDLIEACEHYPDFLPWCSGATVIARDENTVVADITVNYLGVSFDFRTRNPKKRPTAMTIHLERGPFRHFDGVWELTPLAADGCRIDFGLRYDFDSTAMARLARPVFDRIANTLVDRFVARADQVHATGGAVAAAGTSTVPPPLPIATMSSLAPITSTRVAPEPGLSGNSDDPFHRSPPP